VHVHRLRRRSPRAALQLRSGRACEVQPGARGRRSGLLAGTALTIEVASFSFALMQM
jgi:hypothetical protein